MKENRQNNIESFFGNTKRQQSLSGCELVITTYDHYSVYEEWHSHKNLSISILIEGNYEEELLGKKYSRAPLDVKFVPANVRHICHGYKEKTQNFGVELGDSMLADLNMTSEQIDLMVNKNILDIKFSLLKLYSEFLNFPHDTPTSLLISLYELFNGADKVKENNRPPKWISHLKELLQDQWKSPPDLKTISNGLGIHPVTISKYFPKYCASTMSTYIRKIRIERSLGMIREKKLSLTAIAYECGFADQAHFTRSFKDITGYLPKDFRNL